MKSFFKMLHDVIKYKRAISNAKRKVRWYKFLTKFKWGRFYLAVQMSKNNGD